MRKLKNMFSNISESIKQTYNKFPLTIIAVYILTIIVVFLLDTQILDNILPDVMAIISISTIGIFFTETITQDKLKKAIGTLISILISFVFDFILPEITSETDFFARLLVAYTSIIPLLSIYNLAKKAGAKFQEYILKSFSNFCKNLITYIILNIGISIVMSIFIILILDGEHWSILLRTLGLILGFYYIPSLINSFSNMNVEVGKFIKGLIFYVFTPLITLLIGIIYIYLIKIIISGELLNKALFFILSLIFIVAFPIVLMLKNYEENKTIKKVLNIVTYAYIPFIFLQIYAMSIRVSDYGLTPSRYMGYMLVFFEVVFLILLIGKKSKYIRESIIVIIVLVFIGTLTPFNIMEVSYKSQASRVRKILSTAQSFNDLSEKDKEKCYGAYKYLRRDKKENYAKISKEEEEQILSYNKNKKIDYSNEESIYCKKELDGLDISKYTNIYKIKNYRENEFKDDFIESADGKIKIRIDLEEYISSIINANETGNDKSTELFENHNIIESENGEFDLYITSLTIRYNTLQKEVIYTNLTGYLLKK